MFSRYATEEEVLASIRSFTVTRRGLIKHFTKSAVSKAEKYRGKKIETLTLHPEVFFKIGLAREDALVTEYKPGASVLEKDTVLVDGKPLLRLASLDAFSERENKELTYPEFCIKTGYPILGYTQNTWLISNG